MWVDSTPDPLILLGLGGVFHQARGFLPITLEAIRVRSRNLMNVPKI